MTTSYDSVLYPSNAYPKSAPDQLYATAKLFSLSPPAVKTARVLELGCASGGNLLPLAARYPDARFVGLDLSEKQIELADAAKAELALENIDFIAADMTAHDFGDQQFDYVIVHGIFSWVPTPVQDRIFEICQKHMTDDGVAYISYNTLPGWNAVKTIRDMMVYHGQNFDDPGEKVQQARKMLTFVSENLGDQESAYARSLQNEIKMLAPVSNNYLLHDHLEAVNEPCYLYEFTGRAQQYGLGYLGDVNLPTMFLGNLKDQANQTLKDITDTVRLEQYMDFISNRRFRMTLLTKTPRKINRALDASALDDLYLYPMHVLEKPIKREELDTLSELALVSASNAEAKSTMTGRALCMCYVALLQAKPQRLTLDEVIAAAAELAPDLTRAALEREFKGIALRLLFQGILGLSGSSFSGATTLSDKPKAFAPAQLKARTVDQVPNLLHDTSILSVDQRVMLQYVTGDKTIADIMANVRGHIEKGELTLRQDGGPVTPDSEGFDAALENYVRAQLLAFARSGLLVS